MTGCLQDGLSGSAGGDVHGLIRRIRDAGGRHIAVGGTLNFRDTGGYPVTGGGVTRWRQLLRSDGLHRVDGDGLGVLAALGLRTVLDLRTTPRRRSRQARSTSCPGRGAHHGCLIDRRRPDALPADLTAIYDFIIDNRGTAIGAAIRSPARPGALPRWSTARGQRQDRDRGRLRARGGGVPEEFVAADYALSGTYLTRSTHQR